MKTLILPIATTLFLAGCGHDERLNRTDCKQVARLATDAYLADKQVAETSHEGIIAAMYQLAADDGGYQTISKPAYYSDVYSQIYGICLADYNIREK